MNRKILSPLCLLLATIFSLPLATSAQQADLSKGNDQYAIATSAQLPEEKQSHFTWGADIGSAIDLSGNSLSSISLDAIFGYKTDIIDIVGAGAAINMAFSNGNRMFPIYATLRTNFMQRQSLLFLDLRAGCSINYLEESETQTGFYGSAGVGINLAISRKFKSHLILSYNYTGLNAYSVNGNYYNPHDLNTVSIRLGIRF